MSVGPNRFRPWQGRDTTTSSPQDSPARALHVSNSTPGFIHLPILGMGPVSLRPPIGLILNTIVPSLDEENTEVDASESTETQSEEIPRDRFRTSHPPNDLDILQADMDTLEAGVENLEEQVSNLRTGVNLIGQRLNNLREQAGTLGVQVDVFEERTDDPGGLARQMTLARMEERLARRSAEQAGHLFHQLVFSEAWRRAAPGPNSPERTETSGSGSLTQLSPAREATSRELMRAMSPIISEQVMARLEERMAQFRADQVERSVSDENGGAGNGADEDGDVDGQDAAEESSAGR